MTEPDAERPLSDQTERHLTHHKTTDDGLEVYYWPDGEEFLILPSDERQARQYREMFEADGHDVTRIGVGEEEKWVFE